MPNCSQFKKHKLSLNCENSFYHLYLSWFIKNWLQCWNRLKPAWDPKAKTFVALQVVWIARFSDRLRTVRTWFLNGHLNSSHSSDLVKLWVQLSRLRTTPDYHPPCMEQDARINYLKNLFLFWKDIFAEVCGYDVGAISLDTIKEDWFAHMVIYIKISICDEYFEAGMLFFSSNSCWFILWSLSLLVLIHLNAQCSSTLMVINC